MCFLVNEGFHQMLHAPDQVDVLAALLKQAIALLEGHFSSILLWDTTSAFDEALLRAGGLVVKASKDVEHVLREGVLQLVQKLEEGLDVPPTRNRADELRKPEEKRLQWDVLDHRSEKVTTILLKREEDEEHFTE